jgi:hypothetical protein
LRCLQSYITYKIITPSKLISFRMIRVCSVLLLSGLEIRFFSFTIECEGPREVTVAAVRLPFGPVRWFKRLTIMLTSLRRITLGFKKYKRHYVSNWLFTDFNFPAHSIECLRKINIKTKTPWPESASELYRQGDSRLSAKLVPSFADRVCHVVSVTDSYGRILGFLDRSR